MHITHSLAGKKADEHAKRDAAFLLSNKKGNFLSLGGANFSHMQGLFFFDAKAWSPYKAIESVHLDAEPSGIANHFSSAARSYKSGAHEEFCLFNNSMHYKVRDYVGDITLDLDFRHIFDYDDRGRIYSITAEDGLIVVRYDKYADDSLSRITTTRFLVIKGAVAGFKSIGQWIRKEYSYDARRGSRGEAYVYRGLALKCEGSLDIVFSFSDDKAEAADHARNIHENLDYFTSSMKKYAELSFSGAELSCSAALKALDDLLVTIDAHDDTQADQGPGRIVGVYAGLPWFYQFWSRDELVSLKAFMLQEKYELAKHVLMRYAKLISDDGLLPNRYPSSEVHSIDSIGWLFHRLGELLAMLAEKKILHDYFSAEELAWLRDCVERAVHGLVHAHAVNGFISARLQETWMDTREAARHGACIEVQALFLSMLSTHNELSRLTRGKQVFRSVEKEFRDKVRKEFLLSDGRLIDSLNGGIPVIVSRPNIFLAHYLYPDLLSRSEWKVAFDIALQDLWLDWGGLSTISHTFSTFCLEHTGENDKSYHNGDSWYFVNNLAAIAMRRVDKSYYASRVERIRHASREELLFSGFIGCAAELSSAKQLRSEGCLSQAWSAATYVELMDELGNTRIVK